MGWLILIVLVYVWAQACEDPAERRRSKRNHRVARGVILGKAAWDLHNIDKKTRY